MRKIALAASFIVAPALVQAQAGVQAQANVNASASASGKKGAASASSSAQASGSASAHRLGVDAQTKLDAMLRVASDRNLPEDPIRQRVAEGQAKGATDAQIVAASGRTLLDMETAVDAMARGGRAQPSDAEVARGGSLIARGYTSAQIEGVTRKASSGRSLNAAFDVLASLKAHGVGNSSAVAQVESQLAANATDAQLASLATSAGAGAGLSGALNGGLGSGSGSATTGVAGSAAAGAGVAASGAVGGATSGATAGVAGTVKGVLGKP